MSHGQPYTPYELRLIRGRKENDHTFVELGELLGRTGPAISQKAALLEGRRQRWNPPRKRPIRPDQDAQWSHEARLIWLYGPDRTGDIISGKDPKTNADLAAWRALGRAA